MPDPKAWRLPEPENDADFEVLCVALYKAYKKPRVEPERFGRKGQKQHGLDFVLDLAHGLDGYQCKCTRTIELDVVEAELAGTATFPGTLSSFTVLTTAPRDAKLQADVYALSQARRKRGEFPVGIVFWETLCDLLAEHIDVLKAHFEHLVPDLDDLLQGRARRLDREFPGTTVSYHPAPGKTDVTLHPGPDGVPLTGTFFGKDVHERFKGAMRTGRPATFSQEEFDLRFPAAVEQALGRRIVEPGGVRTLTITPSINGARLPARLLVEPIAAHHTVAIFVRRGTKSAEGAPATVTIIECGTDRLLMRVEADTIPLAITIEQVGEVPVMFRFDRPYAGEPVARALAAERLLQKVNAGAYVGVFCGKAHWAIRTDRHEDAGSPLGTLEGLNELMDLADWDMLVPDAVGPEDAEDVADLLDLFRQRRRVVGRGGSAHIVVDSLERIQTLRDFLTAATKPLTSEMEQDAMDIVLLGQTFRLPPIRRTIARIEIPEESATRIMSATGPPVEIDILIPDDVEVVEELGPSGERHTTT